MTPPRRRSRSVPPKGRPIRPATPPPSDPTPGAPAASSGAAFSSSDAGEGGLGGAGASGSAGAGRGPTRSQNRAAKRATGVRPKAVARGRVTGRQQRSTNTGLIAAIVGVFVLGVVGLAIAGGFGGPAASPSPGPSATPAATRLLTGCPTAAPAGLAAGEERTVTIETTKGTIVIEVSADLAPVAAANFIALAECGYYDGVIFHRVIPDFVVQGGDGQFGWTGALDRTRVGSGDAGYEFDDEPVVGEYVRGAVVMANGGPDTNGSQFFICVADLTERLDKDYVLFGHVTNGMDVADQIVAAPRNADDLPDDPVAMTKLTVAAAPTPAPPTPTPAPPTPAPSAGPSATP